MIKVNGNEELFERIKLLSNRVLCQATYVQNDMELTQADIVEFIRMNDEQTKEMAEIKQAMLLHIKSCNG